MNKLALTKLYIGTLILLVLVWQSNANVTDAYLLTGLALAVVLLGLPHGALDFALAQSLGYVSSIKSGLVFIVSYTAVASFSVVFWLYLPATALLIFLLVSIYHFSADWRHVMPNYASISLASVVICGPAILYSSTVQSLFTSLLVRPEASANIIIMMQCLFALSLLTFTIFFGKIALVKHQGLRITRWQTTEWLALLISAISITPLLHFGLYFCLLHSPKHLFDISKKLNITLSTALAKSFPFILLCVFIGIICYAYTVQAGIVLELSTVLLRWLFIGLFGLTMSHMLLVSVWHKEK